MCHGNQTHVRPSSLELTLHVITWRGGAFDPRTNPSLSLALGDDSLLLEPALLVRRGRKLDPVCICIVYLCVPVCLIEGGGAS